MQPSTLVQALLAHLWLAASILHRTMDDTSLPKRLAHAPLRYHTGKVLWQTLDLGFFACGPAALLN